MEECSKRQHENYKGQPRDRCLHSEASTYLQIVTEPVCNACPVRQFASKGSCPGCKPPVPTYPPKTPKNPLPPEVDLPTGARYIGDYADLKRMYGTDASTYPVPVLETLPEYPLCPYRVQGKEGPLCSVTNLGVNVDICRRCTDTTVVEERKNQAKLGSKIYNFFGAVRRWVASGRPTRTKEEIEKLFEEHCSKCEMYDKEKHACKSCGCPVAVSLDPLDNKLAMATEHCPLGRF